MTDKKEPWIVGSLNQMKPEERLKGKGSQFADPFIPAFMYHEASKYYPDLMSQQAPHTNFAVPNYRDQRTDRWIDIPDRKELPPLDGALGDVLIQRRSRWDFEGRCNWEELVTFVTYALGPSRDKEVMDAEGKTVTLRLRTYPSGGALYPIEPRFYIQRVDGVKPGMYRYSAFDHRLYWLDGNDHYPESIAALTPSTDPNRNPLFTPADFKKASIFCFLIAHFTYQGDKYGPRAYRLALLEAGHVAQNLLLVATALGWTSVPLAGFYDDRAHRLLHLDGLEQALLYLIPLGKPKEE